MNTGKPVIWGLKKDLREQEDLVDWYLFHSSFNKYKLFLHSLFYNNHDRLKGSNPNAGFIQIFNESQIDSISNRTEEALKWLNRRYILIDCKDKTIKKKILDIAEHMIKDIEYESISDDVFWALDAIDVNELWNSSGSTPDGYISTDEMVI